MIIYADVLIITNFAVNYFILLATSRLARLDISLWRLIAGAALGALFSLYILAPSLGALIEFPIRLAFAAAIVFAAFGPRPWRMFLRLWAVFFAATFLFGGIMLAVYTVFEPEGMAVDGGVVYFNISPLLLVGSTSLCYCLIRLIQRLAARRNPSAGRIKIALALGGKRVEAMAMVDTGHSLTDPFSGTSVILISPALAQKLLPGGAAAARDMGCYRLIPCQTAKGSGILEGFRIDEILAGKSGVQKPIVAIGENIGGDDYEAIISPELLS